MTELKIRRVSNGWSFKRHCSDGLTESVYTDHAPEDVESSFLDLLFNEFEGLLDPAKLRSSLLCALP